MKAGTISLYRDEEILRSRAYDTVAVRKRIIEMWSKMYGERFSECCIQIAPEVDSLRVHEDGTNKQNYNTRKILPPAKAMRKRY